jgi:hypothetical protein
MSAERWLTAAGRRAAKTREALHFYRYPQPTLRATALQRGEPTVYFATPDINRPSGGIRVAYRHVDLLNRAGIPAAVLHARTGFRCTWFENATRVTSAKNVEIGPEDLVVTSEVGAWILENLPPGHRFVVFNQGPHLTWQMPDEAVDRYTHNPDLAAIITVSEHGAEMLRYATPTATVRRVHNSIDPAVFFPGDAERGRRIAYMPRRGRDEARQVLGIMHARGTLAGWEVTPLEGLSEREVADQLRRKSVFVSFAYQEGFGLPPAEAMACGAYVVGFHGFGGREFLRPEFSSPVPPGDTVALVRALEGALQREATTPGWCAAMGREAAAFISDEYSPAREREDVVGTYAALLAPPESSPPQPALVEA